MPFLSRVLLAVTVLSGCGSVVIVAPGSPDGGGADVNAVVDRPAPQDLPAVPDRLVVWDLPAPDVRRTCTRSSDCRPGEECTGGEGCGVPWVCGPALGRPCTDDLAPFCGCDGTTFFGSSTCPERPYSFRGPCESPPPPPPPGCMLPDGRSCGLGERCLLDRCTSCVCSERGELSCVNNCVPDAGTRACRTGSDCAANELCMGPEGCGVQWTCRAGPIGCTADLAPFCGCDGTTFFGSSSCPMRPYQHRGPCGGSDGGVRACNIRGVQCPVNSRCQIDRCTVCTCSADLSTSCAVSSDCVFDAGAAVDAGAVPNCSAMVAMGEGACDLFLGFTWTGGACRGISGCRCVGSDCARLTRSQGECEERFGHCPRIGP